MIGRGAIAALLIASASAAGFILAPDISSKRDEAEATRANRATASPDGQPGNEIREFLSPAQQVEARRRGLLPAGTRSLLRTDGQMRHGEFTWNDEGVPPGPLTIWVDLRTQLISVFRNGHEIGTAVVVYGDDTMESPLGRFPILSKHRDYHSRSYDAPMPFSMFITNTGVALHGSPMSRRRATHGCIGLPNEFAELLFDAAEIGNIVEIVRSADPQPPKHSAARDS